MTAQNLSTVEAQSRAFNIGDAKRYGVDAAIIIANLRYWMIENRARNYNIHDGRVWSFNSASSWAELFPFWSANKMQKTLKKMEKDGILLVGNYNKMPYDRTKWYSLPDFVFDGRDKNQPREQKPLSQMAESKKPESLTNTNINTNINKITNNVESVRRSCEPPSTENPSTVKQTDRRFANQLTSEYQHCKTAMQILQELKADYPQVYDGSQAIEQWDLCELTLDWLSASEYVDSYTSFNAMLRVLLESLLQLRFSACNDDSVGLPKLLCVNAGGEKLESIIEHEQILEA